MKDKRKQKLEEIALKLTKLAVKELREAKLTIEHLEREHCMGAVNYLLATCVFNGMVAMIQALNYDVHHVYKIFDQALLTAIREKYEKDAPRELADIANIVKQAFDNAAAAAEAITEDNDKKGVH